MPEQIHVIIRHGRAVIAADTYTEAREWVASRENSVEYTIDYIQLTRSAKKTGDTPTLSAAQS